MIIKICADSVKRMDGMISQLRKNEIWMLARPSINKSLKKKKEKNSRKMAEVLF